MDKIKTLKKHKKLPKKSMTINGVKLFRHDPSLIFKNHKEIKFTIEKSIVIFFVIK